MIAFFAFQGRDLLIKKTRFDILTRAEKGQEFVQLAILRSRKTRIEFFQSFHVVLTQIGVQKFLLTSCDKLLFVTGFFLFFLVSGRNLLNSLNCSVGLFVLY